MAPLEHRS